MSRHFGYNGHDLVDKQCNAVPEELKKGFIFVGLKCKERFGYRYFHGRK